MFRGVQQINMDAKGRIAMPTKHRDALLNSDNGHLIATIDIQSRCLLLYPLATWEEIEQKLQAFPTFDPASRRVKRLMLGYATELEMDANGRMLLPPALREYAGLDKKLILAGQGKNFELWSEEHWMAETEQAIADTNSGELVLPEDIQGLVL